MTNMVSWPRTNFDPGTRGGLVPRQDPNEERQQETEDPIPIEQIQDETENDQDPYNEEDDVKHGGRLQTGVASITFAVHSSQLPP